MPVATRSITEKNEQDPEPILTDATKMATAKPNNVTLQDIMKSINDLEAKMDAKLDNQIKIIDENQKRPIKPWMLNSLILRKD